MDEPVDLVEMLWAFAERLTGEDERIVSDAADELERLRAELGAIDLVLGLKSNDPRDRIAFLKARLANVQ